MLHLLIELRSSLTFKPEIIELYAQIIKDVFKEHEGEREAEIKKIESNVSNLEKQIEKAEDKLIDDTITQEEYRNITRRYQAKIKDLELSKARLFKTDSNCLKYLQVGASILKNLDSYYLQSDIGTKQKLIGSIFPEKLIFEDNNYRTTRFSQVIALLCEINEDFQTKKRKPIAITANRSINAPPPGLEPGTY